MELILVFPVSFILIFIFLYFMDVHFLDLNLGPDIGFLFAFIVGLLITLTFLYLRIN